MADRSRGEAIEGGEGVAERGLYRSLWSSCSEFLQTCPYRTFSGVETSRAKAASTPRWKAISWKLHVWWHTTLRALGEAVAEFGYGADLFDDCVNGFPNGVLMLLVPVRAKRAIVMLRYKQTIGILESTEAGGKRDTGCGDS